MYNKKVIRFVEFQSEENQVLKGINEFFEDRIIKIIDVHYQVLEVEGKTKSHVLIQYVEEIPQEV